MVNSAQILIWSFIAFDSLILLGGIWYLVYITWFDNRLRVVLIDSKKGVKITKVKTSFDNRFKLDEMTYTIDHEAIYRRFFKIPYAFYWVNNPNPIKFEKKDKTVKAIYTAQELHDLLETNYTLNLIKQKVNVKRIVIGTVVMLVLGGIVLVILHATGVINISEFMLSTGGGAK